MTPKEQAEQLIDIFQAILESPLKRGLSFQEAKQCALIAVDEILNEFLFDDSDYSNRRFKFYQEVKQEIELL